MSAATQVRERPILFNGEMVRAIRDGRKTMTRRVVNPRYPFEVDEREDGSLWPFFPSYVTGEPGVEWIDCPYGQPGDRLWVRETHAIVPRTAFARSDVQQTLRPDDNHDAAIYAADWPLSRPGRWRPSIHMPRWASRILLEITDVRVERVQEITSRDAYAEGCPVHSIEDSYAPEVIAQINALPEEQRTMAWRTAPMRDDRPPAPKQWFRERWDSINGPRGFGWDADPWVWVVGFRRVEP